MVMRSMMHLIFKHFKKNLMRRFRLPLNQNEKKPKRPIWFFFRVLAPFSNRATPFLSVRGAFFFYAAFDNVFDKRRVENPNFNGLSQLELITTVIIKFSLKKCHNDGSASFLAKWKKSFGVLWNTMPFFLIYCLLGRNNSIFSVRSLMKGSAFWLA